MRYMLDVRRLQVLRAVVTSGSVTAAAANLGYTPSAISQQLAALERETGIALLERAGRGVRPTAAGRLLSGHAAVISENVAEAERALADLRAGRTGRIAIRYFGSVGPSLLAPALATLRREHESVAVDLALIDNDEPMRAISEGDADLAIMVGASAAGRPGIRLIHLIDDTYRVVLPKDHSLAEQSDVDLAALADQPWIGSEPPGPCLTPILDACASAGFSPDFVAKSEDYATAQGFVAAGLGVSLIPRLGLSTRHPGVVVRPLRRPEPARAVYAAVREVALQEPAIRTLLEALRAECRSAQSRRSGQPKAD